MKKINELINILVDGLTKEEITLNCESMKQLLDYITNLQEENERLKEIVENLTTMTVYGDRKQIKNTAQYKLDICKSRIDKAIEYIKFTINHYKEQLKTPIEDTYFDTDINRKGYILSIVAYLQTTLDILQGSDK